MTNVSIKKDKMIFLIYFLPGTFYFLINSIFARRISNFLNFDLWFVQMLIIFFTLFIPMLFIPFIYYKKKVNNTFKQTLKELGFFNFKWVNLIYAVVFFIPTFFLFKYLWGPYVFEPLYDYLDTKFLFHIPEWHWQKIGMEQAASSNSKLIFGIGLSLLLIGNHLGEEVFFRGFLLKKTEDFTGKKIGFIIAGLLFILHHTWQAAKTYPLFPIGIIISGFYAWRRDIYSVILLHFLFNFIL